MAINSLGSQKDRLQNLKSMLDTGISNNPDKKKDLVDLRLEVMGLISKEEIDSSRDFQESITNLETKVHEKLAEIQKAKVKTQVALGELKKGVGSSSPDSKNIDYVQAAQAGKQIAELNIDDMIQPANDFYGDMPLFGKMFSYLSKKSKSDNSDNA